MSANNNCNFTGNLTSDAELGGNAEYKNVKLRLAVNGGTKAKPKTTYIDVVYWTKGADNLLQYLEKGKKVQVVGELETDEWVDKVTGQNRSKPFLNANDLSLLSGGKPDGGGETPSEAPKAKGRAKKSANAQDDVVPPENDTNIPF